VGIARFKVVPVISVKRTFKMAKMLGRLSYPLSVFNRPQNEAEKAFFIQLVRRLKTRLEQWEVYRPIRGMIEDVFKLAKEAFSLKRLHRYTERSVKKIVCLDVLLVGVAISLGITSKEELQRFAEW